MNRGGAALLLAATSFAVLAAEPASARDRVEHIAGWRLSAGGTGDGGRRVGLSRRGRGYRFEHHLEFWRGNGGVVIEAGFRRGACATGDAPVIVSFEQGLGRETFELRLADYLSECPLPPADAAELRRTLDLAWPRFAELAERARAETDAENEAIARHGEPD